MLSTTGISVSVHVVIEKTTRNNSSLILDGNDSVQNAQQRKEVMAKIRVTLTKSGVCEALNQYVKSKLGLTHTVKNYTWPDSDLDEVELHFEEDEDQLELDLPEPEEPAVKAPFS